MMLVLAVRTDPDRVYQRALRYFSPAELSEAFSATRGVASPTQLRAFMKKDPRDLLGTFRALAPPRGAAAAVFSVLMALSRAYLGAHWLSDALAGVLLGASCALLAAFVVGELQGRWTAHRAARSAHPPIPGTVRPADRR